MADVLLLHTVAASTARNEGRLRDAIAERRPDLDLALAATPAESREEIGDAEVVLASGFPADLLESAGSLRWVQALSSGVDSYPRDRLREAGVILTNASGVHGEPIAEQVFAYMLAFERRLHRGMRQQERSVWEKYQGGELRGKTLGIVGVGAIGSRIAEYGATFGMTVVGTKRDPSEVPAAVDEIHGPDGLDDVLAAADYLAVACPLTDETRGLIGAAELGILSSSAVLINIARGEIVDEAALETALQQGGLRGAGLDVFAEEPLGESPLWDLSNVIVTPHMAGSTDAERKAARLADLFAENYAAFERGDFEGMPTRLF